MDEFANLYGTFLFKNISCSFIVITVQFIAICIVFL